MGLDSVELIVIIEKKFGIIIGDNEAEKLTTVLNLYDIVKMKTIDYTPYKIKAIINQILVDLVGVKLKDISPDKTLTSDLGID